MAATAALYSDKAAYIARAKDDKAAWTRSVSNSRYIPPQGKPTPALPRTHTTPPKATAKPLTISELREAAATAKQKFSAAADYHPDSAIGTAQAHTPDDEDRVSTAEEAAEDEAAARRRATRRAAVKAASARRAARRAEAKAAKDLLTESEPATDYGYSDD